MSMSTLETHYRRLLALYPAEHRRLFGDEMLGVLMSSAADGQQRPRVSESVDLMWHGLWRRLGGVMRPRTYGHWSMAAAVVGVVGPLSLLAMHLSGSASVRAWFFEEPVIYAKADYLYRYLGIDPEGDWTLAAAAALLALIVLFGPRWLAIVAAWVVAAATVVVPYGASFAVVLGQFANGGTQLFLTLTTAVALTVPQPAREGSRLLGGRGVVTLAAIAVVFGGLAIANIGWLDTMTPSVVVSRVAAYLPTIFLALALIAGTVVLWRRLDPPVRRRAIVLLAPSGVLYLIAVQSLFYFFGIGVGFDLTFVVALMALGFVLLRRWERVVHLVELGRAAEKAAGAARETAPAQD